MQITDQPSTNILMDTKEWQRKSLPIEELYNQLDIINKRQQIALEMGKPEMANGLQSGIDRLNKIIAYRLSTDNNETNQHDE